MTSRIFKFVLPLLILNGCTHRGAQADRDDVIERGNFRLARAQVAAQNGVPIRGIVDFEQMPNSVIVVFRIEGLEPNKKDYQMLIIEDGDCSAVNLKSAPPLITKMRTNKQGIAEHTFKTVQFSVSGENSLVGNTLVIASRPANASVTQPPVPFACGTIEPLNPANAGL